MRLLIDTHVLVWMFEAPSLIPDNIRVRLHDKDNTVFVSAVSAWEIALKVRIGKLVFDPEFLADFDANVHALSFSPLAVNAAQMIAGAQIQSLHKDPFDRMLAGQVLVEQLNLISIDTAFKSLRIPTIW
jgi:PIN domain nuclease of toxin-antitoxin system